MRVGQRLMCLHTKYQQYVPKHEPIHQDNIKRLENFLLSKPNIVVLTGAGISTESGIPDYRSEGVGLYAKSNFKPIQHSEFVNFAHIRQRYWARSFVGWPRLSATEPNATHFALARFERENRIQTVVTQNVDRLHTKAGSKNIIELHGSAYDVNCLECDFSFTRHEFHNILISLNQEFSAIPNTIRPDGDVDIPETSISTFRYPSCPNCDGILKPHIVFFGDRVPQDRLHRVVDMINCSDGLLVLGSSLSVFSGYRMVLQTKNDFKLPVAIVNIGTTRADHLADLKLSAKCGDVIPKLFNYRKESSDTKL